MYDNLWSKTSTKVYLVFLSINIGQQKHILFERKNLFENGTKRQVRKPLKLMLFDFRLAVKFQVLIGGEHFQYGHFLDRY